MGKISRLDIKKLDAALLDDSTASPDPLVGTDVITFNDYGLQNANIITERVIYNAPTRILSKRERPIADGAYIETDRYDTSHIQIAGHLAYATRALLEAGMDDLRQNLSAPSAVLKIPWESGNRFFDCYVSDMSRIFDGRLHHHITTCPFAFEIACFNPYGRDLTRTVYTAPSRMNGMVGTFEIINAGSARTEPIYYITFLSAGTVTSITLENTANDEAITIAETFVDGDYIVINRETREVRKNGTLIDYTGIFPKLDAGSNKHTLTINAGNGASIAFGEQHYARFL